jgi:hypothetical protein
VSHKPSAKHGLEGLVVDLAFVRANGRAS